MRETNKDDLKKTYRGERYPGIRTRVLAVYTIRVRKKGIGEATTDLMKSEDGCIDVIRN